MTLAWKFWTPNGARALLIVFCEVVDAAGTLPSPIDTAAEFVIGPDADGSTLTRMSIVNV